MNNQNKIMLDMANLCEAVANIDGGCPHCIEVFLSMLDHDSAEKIVSYMNDKGIAAWKIEFRNEKWECA